MAALKLLNSVLYVLFYLGNVLTLDYNISDILEKPEIDKCDGRIKNCYCTDRVIDCDRPEFSDITEIYPFVSINVVRISITGGNIIEIPDGLFQNGDGKTFNRLTYLSLSDNKVESMGFDAFRYLPKLTTLDLSKNNIKMNLCEAKMYDSPFAELKHLEELSLHHAFDVIGQDWQCNVGNIFSETYLPRLKTFDISSNGFSGYGKHFTNFLCNNSVTMTHVNLANNRFQRFPVPPCMDNIIRLDFSNNSLEFLQPVEMDIIESFVNAKEIRLGGNPFRCDCLFFGTYQWLNSTEQPLDFKMIKCSNESFGRTWIGAPVLTIKLNATKICEEPRIIVCFGPVRVHLARSTLIAIVLASCFLLAIVVFTGLYILHRRKKHSGAVRVPTEGPKVPPYDRMA